LFLVTKQTKYFRGFTGFIPKKKMNKVELPWTFGEFFLGTPQKENMDHKNEFFRDLRKYPNKSNSCIIPHFIAHLKRKKGSRKKFIHTKDAPLSYFFLPLFQFKVHLGLKPKTNTKQLQKPQYQLLIRWLQVH